MIRAESMSTCPDCGCVVENTDLHRRWHERLGYPAPELGGTGESLTLRFLPNTIGSPADWLGEPVFIGDQFYVVSAATDRALTLTPHADPYDQTPHDGFLVPGTTRV